MKNTTDSINTTLSRDLEALNRLAAVISATSRHYDVAMMDNRHRDVKSIWKFLEAVKAEFESLRARMPALKFDYSTGEYFLAKDENGRELYHVKATLSATAVFEIATGKGYADARREAERRLRKMLAAGEYESGVSNELMTEDVGSN